MSWESEQILKDGQIGESMKIPKPKFIKEYKGRVKNPKLVLVEDSSVPEGFRAVKPNRRKV